MSHGHGSHLAVPTREELTTIFERRQDAYENLDARRLAADYREDCIVDSPTAGRHEGRQAIEEVFRAWFKAFLDFKMVSEQLIIDGPKVAQVLRIEGTDIGGFMGLPPTHKAFHVPVVCVFEFDGQQIVREQRIYDYTGLLVQIGVLKAKPA
jgi:steroid delta-isomerase-like uncharacterized protein